MNDRQLPNRDTRPRVGIVAGGGAMPMRLLEACREQGRDIFLLGLEGQAEHGDYPPDIPQAWIRIGAAGSALELLREAGVVELVLAGAVRRPSLRELAPDARTARFLARLGLRALGDDGLLKAIIAELEREGFRVIGADALLAGALAVPGYWGRYRPDAESEADIARGLEVALALGQVDVGQSVVVQQGLVLGVEAVEGTDALLRRAGGLRRPGHGGVLVKIAKPGQERRADLPVVGPVTVAAAAEAGLAGIAVAAQATLVLDRERTVAAADEAGLFIGGVTGAPS